MACTSGTVGCLGHPALCATRESAPSAPTTTSACSSSARAFWPRSTFTRKPVPLLCRSTNRLPKETFAPWPCASLARSRIRRDRSMIRSGRSRGTWAARPSVNNSNLWISLTTEASPSCPSRVRMWLVTISVRGVGSSWSDRSSTSTAHPARARREAVKKPEAEPPITATCGPDLVPRPSLSGCCSVTFPRFKVLPRADNASTWKRFHSRSCGRNARARLQGRPPVFPRSATRIS